MSEYHKIETLYERDEATFKVRVGVLKNPTYSMLKTWHWDRVSRDAITKQFNGFYITL